MNKEGRGEKEEKKTMNTSKETEPFDLFDSWSRLPAAF
jgi:hypothetical protein